MYSLITQKVSVLDRQAKPAEMHLQILYYFYKLKKTLKVNFQGDYLFFYPPSPRNRRHGGQSAQWNNTDFFFFNCPLIFFSDCNHFLCALSEVIYIFSCDGWGSVPCQQHFIQG